MEPSITPACDRGTRSRHSEQFRRDDHEQRAIDDGPAAGIERHDHANQDHAEYQKTVGRSNGALHDGTVAFVNWRSRLLRELEKEIQIPNTQDDHLRNRRNPKQAKLAEVRQGYRGMRT